MKIFNCEFNGEYEMNRNIAINRKQYGHFNVNNVNNIKASFNMKLLSEMNVYVLIQMIYK